MAIEQDLELTARYVGDGTQTVFYGQTLPSEADSPVQEEDFDVEVYVADEKCVIGSYTLTWVDRTPKVQMATAPEEGDEVDIVLVPIVNQNASIQRGQAFLPKVVERSLDKAVLGVKSIQERAIMVPASATNTEEWRKSFEASIATAITAGSAAVESAEAAALSATTASNAATSASNAAITASAAAITAGNAATTASNAATSASNAATIAGDAATTASNAATTASASAASAAVSSIAASNWASTASAAATSANNFATTAGNWASTASDAAATAITARGQAAIAASAAAASAATASTAADSILSFIPTPTTTDNGKVITVSVSGGTATYVLAEGGGGGGSVDEVRIPLSATTYQSIVTNGTATIPFNAAGQDNPMYGIVFGTNGFLRTYPADELDIDYPWGRNRRPIVPDILEYAVRSVLPNVTDLTGNTQASIHVPPAGWGTDTKQTTNGHGFYYSHNEPTSNPNYILPAPDANFEVQQAVIIDIKFGSTYLSPSFFQTTGPQQVTEITPQRSITISANSHWLFICITTQDGGWAIYPLEVK